MTTRATKQRKAQGRTGSNRRLPLRRNLFGFGTKRSRNLTPASGGIAKHSAGRSGGSSSSVSKGVRSLGKRHATKTSDGWIIPSLDRDSVFDTKKEAEDWARDWDRNRFNRGKKKKATAKRKTVVKKNHKSAAARKRTRGYNSIFGSRAGSQMAAKGRHEKLRYKMASSAKRKASRFALNAGKRPRPLAEYKVIFSGKDRNQVHAVYATTASKASAIAKKDRAHLFEKPKEWKILSVKRNAGTRKVKRNAGTRRNPVDAAEAVYQKFHGRAHSKTLKITEPVHVHTALSGIGDLETLEIKTPNGAKKFIDFGAGTVLAQNEKRNQLFIRGGDQSVSLKALGIEGPHHEQEILGEVLSVYYYTTKDHLAPEDGGEATYRHKFGSKKPTLVYSLPDKLLSFAGGGYTIPDEGIDL